MGDCSVLERWEGERVRKEYEVERRKAEKETCAWVSTVPGIGAAG